jgi:hypothetical protein
MLYSVDWETANHYATSLAKLLKDFPVSNELLTKDRERLKRAVRVGQGCRKE